jgi:tetratricopeptide (TPR) repeat protein
MLAMDTKTPRLNAPPCVTGQASPDPQGGSPDALQTKIEQAIALEREAHRLRGESKIDQAFQTFDRAAKLFREANEPLKAAVCFSSAATCWNIHTGWQPLRNAATRNESAALQALEAQDHAYAETLFSEAALLYEKEGDFTKYSYCYQRAKDARLVRLWRTFTQMRRGAPEAVGLERVSHKGRVLTFFSWLLGSLNRLIWGYGELPFRTFMIACSIIILSALCYHVSGTVLTGGFVQKIDLFESLYLSIMTYTTVGYGDYLPMGWVRGIAAVEALSGVLITPLFLIALTRRYLRMR